MTELHVQCNAAIGSLQIDAAFTASGPWTVLFGPSGSGKSSLLRFIAGLWQPATSHVSLGEHDITTLPPHKRRIALVAQQPALFPHMDARANVAFGIPGNTANGLATAETMLARFHVAHVARRLPRQLSGGEIKRVAIARAVATSPRLLLLDEVFTGMGASLAAELSQELRAWQQQTGVPVLSVTHDVPEALRADDVIRIDNGRIPAQGRPLTVLSDERKAMMLALSQNGV